MLYGEEIKVLDAAIGDASLATAIPLEHAAGAIFTKTMVTPGTVMRFGFRPTVDFDYATQTAKGVLTLYKYPVAAGTGKVALASIKLEDLDVAGKVYFVKVGSAPADVSPAPGNPADFNAGQLLVIEVTTQAAGGGGIAGDFQPFVIIQNRGENTINQDLMVDRTSL